MRAIQVIDTSCLVTLPGEDAVMVGAPPEALKILLLWEYPNPSTVVLPPDPLFAHGINQASFEFLLYNHLFRMNGLHARRPFLVVCDSQQKTRVEHLARQMLRGPSNDEMAAFRTPASHRRQLMHEMAVVSGEVSKLRMEQLIEVRAFADGRAELHDGAWIEQLPGEQVRVHAGNEYVDVSRCASGRVNLPLYFPETPSAAAGPRFGLQVLGSASGFSGAEWGSCFIVWINGLPLLIDGTPYLDDHLRQLGIEADHILGFLITHNHEDHANALGQLVGKRRVTVLTSGPVMAGLITRLSAILNCSPEEARELFHWQPLYPGMEDYSTPLPFFGAEIRTWYSVHTVPTLGVEVSMDGHRIRMPGDTLWGRQLDPLLEQQVISPKRYRLIQHTYDSADVIVADAGGGPIHPDPHEVKELVAHESSSRMMVTHIPDSARAYLPNAEPGTCVSLIDRVEPAPHDVAAVLRSPIFRDLDERWLLALLHSGRAVTPGTDRLDPEDYAVILLSGSATLVDGSHRLFPLHRGDCFHRSLLPELRFPTISPQSQFTRCLLVPGGLFRECLRATRLQRRLEMLYRTRGWWRGVAGDELGLDALVSLGELAKESEFDAGEPVVSQGELADAFYVVTSGKVEVVRESEDGPVTLGTFGPGFHFGEIALLRSERRTATVRTLEPSRVLHIPGRVFKQKLLEIPVARHRISLIAAQRRATHRRARSARSGD